MKRVASLLLTIFLLFGCCGGYAENNVDFLDDMTLDELNMALSTLKKLQAAIEEKIATYSETPPATEEIVVSADDIEYISSREFFYHSGDEMYYIRFALKNKDETKVICPCTVTARLVDSEGNVVYSIKDKKLQEDDFWTWTWNDNKYASNNGYYATIPIEGKDILQSSNVNGTMYITVTLGNGEYFKETAITVDDLPVVPTTISYAKLPIGVMNGKGSLTKESDVTSAVNITEIAYNVKNDDIYVYLTGEMIAAPLASTTKCRIAWRLKDSSGYVVDSGAVYTDSMGYGEKFKNLELIIWDVTPGAYTLQFQNTSN